MTSSMKTKTHGTTGIKSPPRVQPNSQPISDATAATAITAALLHRNDMFHYPPHCVRLGHLLHERASYEQ